MPSWFRQLDEAESVADVVAVARDYLATWTPEEIALLPRSCRPAKVRDESDIEELHRNAVDAYRETRASGAPLTALQRLTSFVVRACVRIANLRTPDERLEGAEPSADSRSRSAAARER